MATTTRLKRPDTAKQAETKPNSWTALLHRVATGHNVPEKHLFIFGGSKETQREVLGIINPKVERDSRAQQKEFPIANEYALGYTYQDILDDADAAEILARVSVYTLSEPLPTYAKLVPRVVTAKTVPNTFIAILLDWSEPWLWAEQLRSWIVLIREMIETSDAEIKNATEEVMREWQQRRRGPTVEGSAPVTGDASINVPHGPGEWDEPLGLPFCVICHNTNAMEDLEREHTWREEDFDFVLQFLRTVLLKHGASLVYTSTGAPNDVSKIIQSSLGIDMPTRKDKAIKHNVVDRENILIPSNWDTWSKIRVLRDGFDVERLSSLWEIDIALRQPLAPRTPIKQSTESGDTGVVTDGNDTLSRGSIEMYAEKVKDPGRFNAAKRAAKPDIEVTSTNMQEFLASQMQVIEQLKADDEKNANTKSTPDETNKHRLSDQIGPIQFNKDGIQVDVEDVLQHVKEKEKTSLSEREAANTTSPGTPELRAENEKLAVFFANLMKRPQTTPKKDDGSPLARKSERAG